LRESANTSKIRNCGSKERKKKKNSKMQRLSSGKLRNHLLRMGILASELAVQDIINRVQWFLMKEDLKGNRAKALVAVVKPSKRKMRKSKVVEGSKAIMKKMALPSI
jgi:hypothetical protein